MKKVIKFACSILVLAAHISNVLADECTLTIRSNDAMQFDQKSLSASVNCKKITINLIHSGKLAANVMGHNWVLTKASDMMPIAGAGLTAGLDNNYVPQGDDRVLAATKVIGGGESTQIIFDSSILNLGEKYVYFCSFPGHWSIMKGEFKLLSGQS